jgi:transcriptional regulator GlxA family with amidase domain
MRSIAAVEGGLPQRHVVFVMFPDALLLDLSGPLAAFELSCETACAEGAPYRLTVASATGGLVRTSSGIELMSRSIQELSDVDTLVVVGGIGVHEAADQPLLLDWRLMPEAFGVSARCARARSSWPLPGS